MRAHASASDNASLLVVRFEDFRLLWRAQTTSLERMTTAEDPVVAPAQIEAAAQAEAEKQAALLQAAAQAEAEKQAALQQAAAQESATSRRQRSRQH